MKPMELITDEELLFYLANATQTFYSCGGHYKATQNQNIMTDFEEELTRRNIEIPEKSELLEKGSFNGVGAY